MRFDENIYQIFANCSALRVSVESCGMTACADLCDAEAAIGGRAEHSLVHSRQGDCCARRTRCLHDLTCLFVTSVHMILNVCIFAKSI
jgi:hypothetical protein